MSALQKFIAAFLLTLSCSLSAQENPALGEIIINADYRQQRLNEISSSISVLDQTQIDRRHAQHIEEVLLDIPNLNFASGGNRARFFQIRGIGERGQFAEPLNSSVGVMIDNVDFSGAGNAALLYDVEQVEVLMGPQGTRYGSNALAGLINIQSKAPTTETSGGFRLDLGNYDSRSFGAYLSGPLNENLLVRLSAQRARSDGFGENLTLQRPTNQRDESMLRGKLRWQAVEDIRLDLSLSKVDLDNGYDAFSLDNIRDTLSDQPGFDRLQASYLSGTLALNNLRWLDMQIIAAHSDADIDYAYDEDWSFIGLHPDGYASTDQYFRQRKTDTAEIRLLSNESSLLFGGRSAWVFGLYKLQQDVDLTRIYTYLPEPFTSSFTIDRQALFAEINTALNTNWSVDLGYRLERFESHYQDSASLNFTPDETLQGGKLALNYNSNAGNLLYLSVSRGYKAGGFNTDGSLDADLREFGREQLWNYELGYKAAFPAQQLQLQSALFYMSRSDVQIASSTTRLRPDLSTEFIDYIGNAAEGQNIGLEFSANWLPAERWSLDLALGLLQTRYDNFINSAGDDLSGREQAHAPTYQYTLGGSYALSPAWQINLSVQGKDAYYFSDSHNIQSESHALINASIDWQFEQWRLSLWSRNLTDEDYYVRGFYFGNDPRDGYTAKGYTQLGEPRRIGLTVSADF
jgi:iron complex outermembrane receptor protein